MSIEETIRSMVAGLTAVTTLVGTRIYLDKLPQSPTYPCIRVTLVSDLTSMHARGQTGLKVARIQVDSYAKELSGVDPYALVAAVAAAVDGDGAGSGLAGYVDDPAVSPWGPIRMIQRLDRRRQYDPEELRVLTMSQDYQVAYAA